MGVLKDLEKFILVLATPDNSSAERNEEDYTRIIGVHPVLVKAMQRVDEGQGKINEPLSSGEGEAPRDRRTLLRGMPKIVEQQSSQEIQAMKQAKEPKERGGLGD